MKRSNISKQKLKHWILYLTLIAVLISILGCSKISEAEDEYLLEDYFYTGTEYIAEQEDLPLMEISVAELENEQDLETIEKLKDKTIEILKKGDLDELLELIYPPYFRNTSKFEKTLKKISGFIENKEMILREKNYIWKNNRNFKRVPSLYDDMFVRIIHGYDDYWYEYTFDLSNDKDAQTLRLKYEQFEGEWKLAKLRVGYLKLGGKNFQEWYKEYEILRKQEKYLQAYMRYKIATSLVPLNENIKYELREPYYLDSKWFSKQSDKIKYGKFENLNKQIVEIKPDYWIKKHNLGYAIEYLTKFDLNDKESIKEEVNTIHEELIEKGLLDQVGHYAYFPQKEDKRMVDEMYDNSVIIVNENLNGFEPIDQSVESRENHLIKDIELEKIIKKTLNITNENLTKEQLATIEELDVKDASVFDLVGLEYLVNLKKLNISNLLIHDLTPISELKYLENLDVSENKLSNLANVLSSRNLKVLNLYKTEVDTSESIDLGVNIEDLNISSSTISFQEILALKNLTSLCADKVGHLNTHALEKFTKLKKLSLEKNELISIKFIEKLINLEELYLEDNKIKSIDALGNLTKLKKLHLGYNKIESIEPLLNLKNLRELNVRGKNLEPLSKMTWLETLIVSYTNLKNIDLLENLTELKELNLRSNGIKSLSKLKNLKNLEKLNIGYNDVLNIDVLAELTKLKELNLKSTGIKSLSKLKNLKNLEKLNIGYNEIYNVDDLSELTELKELNLYNTAVKSLKPLEHLNKLEVLEIDIEMYEDLSIYEKVNNREIVK